MTRVIFGLVRIEADIAIISELVERVMLKNLDFDPSCDYIDGWAPGEPVDESRVCGRPASWQVRCRACGKVSLSCDEHLERHRDRRRGRPWCSRCQYRARHFDQQWEVTPLGVHR